MRRSPRRSPTRRRTKSGSRAAPASSSKTYRIGEAAKLVGVKPYVLRFWETEFPMLRPSHGQSKHRVYQDKDVEMLRLVKRLLHEQRFTIEGAKKRIKEVGLTRALESGKKAAADVSQSQDSAQTAKHTLGDIKRDLQSLLELLSRRTESRR